MQKTKTISFVLVLVLLFSILLTEILMCKLYGEDGSQGGEESKKYFAAQGASGQKECLGSYTIIKS